MENEKLNGFIEIMTTEVNTFLAQLDTKSLTQASELIMASKNNHGRLHVTGVGKTSYVAGYIASLNSSLGIPTYYLDTTEAVHGSLGQVSERDVIIAISNSGETEELIKTVTAIKNRELKLIGVSGGASSWLRGHVDVFLYAGVTQEGDDLNKPPRASVIVEMLILQCLSILLQETKQLDLREYYMYHPAGAIGKSLSE